VTSEESRRERYQQTPDEEGREREQVSISSTFLRTNFSYEQHFGSFFYLRFGFGKKFVQKMCAFNVDEIDGRCQFHQLYTRTFFSFF
jgi:hypothetical protein